MGIENIRKVCALGTGAMGAGTALAFALAGYDVTMHGRSEDSLAKGTKGIDNALRSLLGHNLITELQAAQALTRIRTTTDLTEAAKDADFVIESIAEEMTIKQDVFAKLDAICPPHTIFSTNTSALDPTEIASATNRPDKFVVCHMWNPPHLMRLVEVVRGEGTSDATADTAYDLMTAIGKKPVRVNKARPGFIGNRFQILLILEAMDMVASGVASPEDVDLVMTETLGRRLGITGPLTSADLGGLDIFHSIARTVGPDLRPYTGVPEMLDTAVTEGRLGAKSGAGIYDWPAERLAAVRAAREEQIVKFLHRDREIEGEPAPARPPVERMPHLVVEEETDTPAPGAAASGQ